MKNRYKTVVGTFAHPLTEYGDYHRRERLAMENAGQSTAGCSTQSQESLTEKCITLGRQTGYHRGCDVERDLTRMRWLRRWCCAVRFPLNRCGKTLRSADSVIKEAGPDIRAAGKSHGPDFRTACGSSRVNAKPRAVKITGKSVS